MHTGSNTSDYNMVSNILDYNIPSLSPLGLVGVRGFQVFFLIKTSKFRERLGALNLVLKFIFDKCREYIYMVKFDVLKFYPFP